MCCCGITASTSTELIYIFTLKLLHSLILFNKIWYLMQGKYPSVGRSPVREQSSSKISSFNWQFDFCSSQDLVFYNERSVLTASEWKQHKGKDSDLFTQCAISQVWLLWQEEGSSGPKTCRHLDKAWEGEKRNYHEAAHVCRYPNYFTSSASFHHLVLKKVWIIRKRTVVSSSLLIWKATQNHPIPSLTVRYTCQCFNLGL